MCVWLMACWSMLRLLFDSVLIYSLPTHLHEPNHHNKDVQPGRALCGRVVQHHE
jgi:hypothetical protein